MRTVLVSCLVASALVCAPVFAQTPVDASQFDVAGVQLGMSADEAKHALIQHFGTEHEDSIRLHDSGNPIAGRTEPGLLELETDNETVRVQLSPDSTKEGAMVVQSISYKLPWSEDNAKRLRDAAIQKYGPASSPPTFTVARWCIDADKYPGTVCNYSKGPNLKVDGTTLTLSDPSLTQRLNEWFINQKSATPRF